MYLETVQNIMWWSQSTSHCCSTNFFCFCFNSVRVSIMNTYTILTIIGYLYCVMCSNLASSQKNTYIWNCTTCEPGKRRFTACTIWSPFSVCTSCSPGFYQPGSTYVVQVILSVLKLYHAHVVMQTRCYWNIWASVMLSLVVDPNWDLSNVNDHTWLQPIEINLIA